MEDNIQKYQDLTNGRNSTKLPKIKTHIPKPSDFDYKKGYVVRYFIQKTNDKSSSIFEVDNIQFSKYKKNPFFVNTSIRWRIKGPLEDVYNDIGEIVDKSVSESNRIAIHLVKHKIPNLKLYLPNLLQFYKR